MAQKLPCLCTALLLFVGCSAVFAQKQFIKNYDHFFSDRANAVEQLPNGRTVLAGATALQNSSQFNMMLLMLNANGSTAWAKTYANGQRTEATDIIRTADGNLLVTFDAFNNSGEAKAGWMKVSTATGGVIWNKTALPNCRLLRISPLSDGYLLTGDFQFAPDNRDALAVKINENGDVVWFNLFGGSGYEQLGGCWQDATGTIHCSGYHIENNASQGLYARFDPNGDMPGAVRRFSVGTNANILHSIAPIEDGGLLLAGNSQGFPDEFARAWTLTIDRDGNLKTSFSYRIQDRHVGVTSLAALPANQFVLSLGRPSPSGTPTLMMKINSAHDMLWQNTYQGDGPGNIVWQCKAHAEGIVAAGTTTKSGQTNLLLVKADLNGQAGDCCPTASGLKREEVSPLQTSYVPARKTGFAAQTATMNHADASVVGQTVCQPIAIDFALSDDKLCPGECTEIEIKESTEGVNYSIDVVGGAFSPPGGQRICHTEGGSLIVTRKGVFNNCPKESSKILEIGAKEDVFPNAFTPNGDGANDVFRPVFPCEVIFSNLKIFSRWGALVFEADTPDEGWDGRINGLDAPSDVYVWRVEYEAVRSGQQQRFVAKGGVTLLR
jgi:gliding motility-associated-like protein